MSLADLIRKREPGKPANDNPAKAANDGRVKGEPLVRLATLSLANLIRGKSAPDRLATATVATHEREKGRPLAGLAALALANPTQGQTAHPVKVGDGDTATASHWWLIHYPERDPVKLACTPDATHAEILERHPDAIAAEPFEPNIRQPSAPMTTDEEKAIRAWLALIEETDPATIADVLNRCQQDADVRDYFTRRAAAELPKPDPFHDRLRANSGELVEFQCAANEPELPADPPTWRALAAEYHRHHFACPTCQAAGQGYGLRCGTGAALWTTYQNTN